MCDGLAKSVRLFLIGGGYDDPCDQEVDPTATQAGGLHRVSPADGRTGAVRSEA